MLQLPVARTESLPNKWLHHQQSAGSKREQPCSSGACCAGASPSAPIVPSMLMLIPWIAAELISRHWANWKWWLTNNAPDVTKVYNW
jgi:hypothetical protein